MALVGKGASPPTPPPPKPIILLSHFSPSEFNNVIPSLPSVLLLLLHSHRHDQQHTTKSKQQAFYTIMKTLFKNQSSYDRMQHHQWRQKTHPQSIHLSICLTANLSLCASFSSLEHTPTIKLVGQNGIALVQRLSNSKRIGWCAVLGLSVIQTLIPQ